MCWTVDSGLGRLVLIRHLGFTGKGNYFMMMRKLNAILAIALGMCCVSVGRANAADELLTSTTRGTAKVQSRVFNPFEVGVSRLSIDPFGIFTLTDPAAGAQTSPFPTGGGSAAATSTTTTSTSTTTSQAADTTVSAPATNTMTLSPLLVRPPFRPPDRSPYRPPPRPPFPP
jgi:hypothetical protein